LALVASLAAGSWVGLGRPSLAATWEVTRAMATAATERANTWREESARQGVAAPPPVDAAPSVDPSLLPDPTPWPRLNPDVSTRRAWLLAEGPYHPPGDGRRLVTFTFDDGPFPETTPTFLKILARHNVRAAFFMLGTYLDGDSERAEKTRQVARDVARAGHLIGNH